MKNTNEELLHLQIIDCECTALILWKGANVEQGNKLLSAFSDFGGAPKNWKMIEDEQERTQIAIINPRYKLDPEYRNNCVNCVMAYELRKRGYDVVAKSRKECNVSAKAESLWYDIEKHSADTLADVISSIDATVDARYFLGLDPLSRVGYAVVLEIKDGEFHLVDPQSNSTRLVTVLTAARCITYTYWRIDNLEVTQTGYNACKGKDFGMTFKDGCKLSYENFKEEYGTGIGAIEEYPEFWVFTKRAEVIEYGPLPIIVYKGDRHPEFLTFEMVMNLNHALDNPIQIPVPEIYTN